MPFEKFDRNKLELKPLSERVHDLTLEEFLDLDSPVPPFHDPLLDEVAGRIAEAHKAGREVLLIMGAYLIRAGVSRFIIDLMERGVITHVAGNGAAAIHDFELALIGATTESVAKYIREGQFGLWREMGLINEAVNKGAREGLGFGEAVGRFILEGNFPYKDISVLAAGCRLGIPVTIHIGIGYDIVHEHPNFDPALAGEASYRDFLILANTVSKLKGAWCSTLGRPSRDRRSSSRRWQWPGTSPARRERE